MNQEYQILSEAHEKYVTAIANKFTADKEVTAARNAFRLAKKELDNKCLDLLEQVEMI